MRSNARCSEAGERAQRLPELIPELKRRSQNLTPPGRERVAEAVLRIAERGARAASAARESDPISLRRDLAELRTLVASMQTLLHEIPER